jgi:hypothetical protein
MFKYRRLVLTLVLVVVLTLFATVVVKAQNEDDTGYFSGGDYCGTITHQVRFLDYNDIFVYANVDDPDEAKAAAVAANAVFRGGAGKVATPTVKVPGGERQKYMLCTKQYKASDKAIPIVLPGGGEGYSAVVAWAPLALVESIVDRYKADEYYKGKAVAR